MDETAAPVGQSVFFEILNLALVFYGSNAAGEGPQIPSLTRLGIFLSSIEPILAGF